MPRFKFDDSPDEYELPVNDSPLPLQQAITSLLYSFHAFKLQDGEIISHFNGKPFEECSKADVMLDELNILRVGSLVAPAEFEPFDLITYSSELVEETMKFVHSNPSPEDLERFIKVIDAVYRVPGPLKQFIAVYAPSLSGKTLLAISLDRYTENPLYPHDNMIPSGACPLRACFRLPCTSAFADRELLQRINGSPIHQEHFKICITADYGFLRAEKVSVLPLEYLVSVSSIGKSFKKNKSETLGFIAAWIRARLDGSERIAFHDRDDLNLASIPLTIQEFMREFQISSSKPFVFFLDEFSLSDQEDLIKGYLLFLRNLLRACGFVVIIMGTNSSAINMIDKAAVGSRESGSNPLLWAQVVTNVFSCTPISQFVDPKDLQESLQARGLSPADVRSIMNWINEGRCVKPGSMETLLTKLRFQDAVSSPAEAVWIALKSVGSGLYSRKRGARRLFYLLGQVEAMISTTRFSNELEPVISSKLLNEHYAALATYTRNPKINIFSLYRDLDSGSMNLFPLVWNPSDHDAKLVGDAVDFSLPENQHSYVMENYVVGHSAEAVYPVPPSASIFIPSTGFATYESDEIGYLGLLANESFDIRAESLRAIGFDNADFITYSDLFRKPNPGPFLSTRAALTVAFRYCYGSEDPTAINTEQNPKRNGFFLEIVSSSAMVIASHNSGLGGSRLAQFLPAFVNELAWKKMDKIKLSDKSIETLGAFADYFIPFIPMIKNTCSDSLRAIPGVNSGTLRMTRDKEEIDWIGYADCLQYLNPEALLERRVMMTGEMKDRELATNYYGLKPIIHKGVNVANVVADSLAKQRKNVSVADEPVAPEAHFHFVVVSKLAIIQEQSWAELAVEYPDVSVYVASSLDPASGILTLEPKVKGSQPKSLRNDQPALTSSDRPKRGAAIKARELQAEILANYGLSDDCNDEAYAGKQDIRVAPFPTCVIIVPVEDLLKDGPIEFTVPKNFPTELAAKRAKKAGDAEEVEEAEEAEKAKVTMAGTSGLM